MTKKTQNNLVSESSRFIKNDIDEAMIMGVIGSFAFGGDLSFSPKEQIIIIKALDSKRYPHEQELEVQTLIGRLYRSLKEIEEMER